MLTRHCGGQFITHINVKALCCTPKTNVILYVNYISIKEKNHLGKFNELQLPKPHPGTLIQQVCSEAQVAFFKKILLKLNYNVVSISLYSKVI